jgi:hypothetical protein
MPLKSIVHRTASGGTVISQHDYTYGSGVEVGQIKTWQRQLPNSGGGSTTTTQTFGYDNILQLTSAAETGQSTKHTPTMLQATVLPNLRVAVPQRTLRRTIATR